MSLAIRHSVLNRLRGGIRESVSLLFLDRCFWEKDEQGGKIKVCGHAAPCSGLEGDGGGISLVVGCSPDAFLGDLS